MIQVVEHNKIDKSRWDKVVEHSPESTICASSWYLDQICPGWGALILDDYRAIMPLPEKQFFGINFLMQPLFLQQLGPIFITPSPSNEDIGAFIEHIPITYKYVDINLTARFTGTVPKGYTVEDNVNYTLKIDYSYKEHFKAFSYNTRRNIKKCPKTLQLVRDFNWQEALDIFSKNKGAELSNFTVSRQKKLMALFNLLNKKQSLETYGVTNKTGKLIAAAFFASGCGKKVFIFSATGVEGKETRAMFFLIDRFIKLHENTGCILDFEGSNTASLARFYKNFGSKKTIYKRIKKNTLPFWLKWIKK